jgi:hypothetical protein
VWFLLTLGILTVLSTAVVVAVIRRRKERTGSASEDVRQVSSERSPLILPSASQLSVGAVNDGRDYNEESSLFTVDSTVPHTELVVIHSADSSDLGDQTFLEQQTCSRAPSEKTYDSLEKSLAAPRIEWDSLTTIDGSKRCEQELGLDRPIYIAEPLNPSREGDGEQFISQQSQRQKVPTSEKQTMRITKRSSGGRGEYEVSETCGSITPRDLLNHTVVLDLGYQIEVTTGVRLLLRNGKLRLRIDETTGCEMHLHRQLAAALMLPYPAREESGWAVGHPVMQSGLYGIQNIELSSVRLLPGGKACIKVATVTVANRTEEEYVQAPERMKRVVEVWRQKFDLPTPLTTLVVEHQRLVLSGTPVGHRAERSVSDLQEIVASHLQDEDSDHTSKTHDVLPLLVQLLQLHSQGVYESTVDSEVESQRDITANAAEVINELVHNETPTAFTDVEQVNVVELGDIEAVPEAVDEDKVRDESETNAGRVNQPPLPRKYRPQSRGNITTRDVEKKKNLEEQREASVPIDIRVRSRVGGSYLLTFLPRRRNGMPSDVEATHFDERIKLSALHEDWYQDVVLVEAGKYLRQGVAWYTEASNGSIRWGLSGRDLFVLGTRDDLSGFISVPRLRLGAEHFVICSEDILERVLGLLGECCDNIPHPLGESDGFPAGWCGIGPVIPLRPLPPSVGGDILDSLRPDPAIEISLGGGLRIQQNQFLVGYPPTIEVRGSIPDFVQVTIDANAADKMGGAFVSPGWDSMGQHIVSCGVASRTYSIVEPDDLWEKWSAYSFLLSSEEPVDDSGSICGALVTMESARNLVIVPALTPVLLGSQPGEIYVTPIRRDLGISVYPAFPSFIPIWAVPQNPLRTKKATARVVLLQENPQALEWRRVRDLSTNRAVHLWCTTILDCSRKGLRIVPEGEQAETVWRSYRDLARHLWRASR